MYTKLLIQYASGQLFIHYFDNQRTLEAWTKSFAYLVSIGVIRSMTPWSCSRLPTGFLAEANSHEEWMSRPTYILKPRSRPALPR